MATPHEQSRSWVPEALAQGLRVVDLSAAWRLGVPENRAIYGFHDTDAVWPKASRPKASTARRSCTGIRSVMRS